MHGAARTHSEREVNYSTAATIEEIILISQSQRIPGEDMT